MTLFLITGLVLVLLAGCTMVITPPASASAPPAESTPVAEVSGEFEVVQLIIDFAPETWTPPHTHGGPGMVSVFEGEITVREEGKETIYRAGDSWIELPGQFLEVGNAGDTPARTSVVFLLPTGASLTTMQEGVNMAEMPPGPTVTYEHRMPVTSGQ
jgi:quercetin dioxygenase-like cupin family protein